MFYSYFQSFNLRFKGRATRKEFATVMIVDMIILAMILFKLYLLNHIESLPYLIFTRPIFRFFYPARWVIYFICLAWFSARYAAWQAVAVRRAHDLGKKDRWLMAPFSKFYLYCQVGTKGENQYGPDPLQST
ncbi:MAG: DUF805 domain-containing protein [Bacteroidota bacterium]